MRNEQDDVETKKALDAYLQNQNAGILIASAVETPERRLNIALHVNRVNPIELISIAHALLQRSLETVREAGAKPEALEPLERVIGILNGGVARPT